MTKKEKTRGFVILIVLAVIATASVVLATQLSSVEGQQGAQIRSTEEAKARDIAEFCLEMADAYAVAWGNNNTDFDQLLDNDKTIGNADDFVPPSTLFAGASNVVSIPPGRAGTHYQYRAFNVTSPGLGGTSGTCYIRYDDNNDDSNALINASTTSNTLCPSGSPCGAEGPSAPNNGADVPERDTDRTIITTVVGVVPQGSSQAAAYAGAHAHATVRRVRAMPIQASLGSAVFAGGTVDFDGSICGSVAGLTADKVQGGVCVCGVLNAQLISGSQGTTNGDCGCPQCASDAGSTTTAGPRTDPPITVPPFISLLANAGFGTQKPPPDGSFTTGNNIASAAYPAVVYFRNGNANNCGGGACAVANYNVAAGNTDVFVWDKNDTATVTTLGNGGAGITTFAGAGAATQNCTDTAALDPIPDPCGWNLTTKTVTCAANESQCWKLVARLGDGATATINFVSGGGTSEQTDGSGNNFAPKAGNLPNVKNTGANTARWQDYSPGSCTTCSGGAFVTPASPSFTVSGANALTDVPHMIMVFDSTVASTTTIGGLTRTGAKIAVYGNNQVSIGGSNQCCPQCDCSSACTASAASKGTGFAIRTSGGCADTSTYAIIGQVMCAQLDLGNSNNNCDAGGLIGLGSSPFSNPIANPPSVGTLACNLPGAGITDPICNANANFCVKNNYDLFGTLSCAGNICMKNNLNMHSGIIQSLGSVGWKNNPVAAGQIMAKNDILGKNNATITFNGTAGAAENQGVASAMWMDAAW